MDLLDAFFYRCGKIRHLYLFFTKNIAATRSSINKIIAVSIALLQWTCSTRYIYLRSSHNIDIMIIPRSHSMARANLNKSEWLVTNTTAASKYIPKRPRICINWNPPFRPHFIKVSKAVNLTSQHSHLEVLIVSKFGSERGDFNWCWFWAS